MSPAHLHKHGIDLAKIISIFEKLPGQRNDLAADGQILDNTLLDGFHGLFSVDGTSDENDVGVVRPLRVAHVADDETDFRRAKVVALVRLRVAKHLKAPFAAHSDSVQWF